MDLAILEKAILDSRDGITISEVRAGENPLIFVNPAFERMTGYAFDEIAARDCRYLQGDDRDQPAIHTVRAAVRSGEYCLATLRNYRKDGTMFWNELSVSPVRNAAGELTNYIGIQKDVTTRVLVEEQLKGANLTLAAAAESMSELAMKDGLTGIYNRRFFDTQLRIQANIAQRSKTDLALILVDIDHFKEFNTEHGHQGGDAALRLVAQGLSQSFTRASDFVARYGGEEFAIVSSGLSHEGAGRFAESLRTRISSLQVPYRRGHGAILTISVGYAVQAFDDGRGTSSLISRADKALYAAKALGRNCCVGDRG